MHFREFGEFEPQDQTVDTPHDRIERDDLIETVHRVAGQLPPQQHDALLARFGLHPEGHTIASLAAMWKTSTQWVYKLAQRSINSLRDEIN